MNRMMTPVAFLQAQNCSDLPGSWRHRSTTLDFTTPEYYQRIARTLEDGGATLREKLGLPIPLAADWQARRRAEQ